VAGPLRASATGGRPAEPVLLVAALGLLRAAESVKAALGRSPGSFPRLAEAAEGLEVLPLLRLALETEIDARGEGRGEATHKLKTLRADIRARREVLRSRASAKLADPRLRQAFQSEGLSVKDDRYLLPVKADYRSWIHGVIRDRSQSGSTLYIEADE